MLTERIKYFAYGSNMNPKRMVARGAEVYSMRFAVLNGFELMFNKLSTRCDQEGFANIQKNERSVVEGILYETSIEGITNLDRYEKYPFEYDRSLFEVFSPEFERVVAYAYIAQPGKVFPDLKPRKYYINHLLAAQDYLSTSYLNRINSVITLD